ncbi:MAG: hypothetical protein M1819_002206 [Sarea resinae]|nr:MAG: hypothetical protein M1819_002206 [Sarea resinae]
MADAVAIEEANKLRKAIGLKSLPVPGGGLAFKEDESSSEEEQQGSTLETREAQGFENWQKLQDEAEAKAKREAKNAAIKRARDAALRSAKLEGKGLGDAEGEEELDTRTWLLQQKKRQKRIEKARKLEQELAEREQEASYTAADLAGVKVGHELDAFEGDGEQVLTLKDTTIDENEEEGDELENVNLREREKLSERLDLKKRRPVYDPNAIDEDGQKSLLGQYDEEIEGKKRKRFTLGAQVASEASGDSTMDGVLQRPKKKAISLDFVQEAPASDYQDASEIKIRKPKKKKAKSTRQKKPDEDEIFPSVEQTATANDSSNAMDVDSGQSNANAAPPVSRKRVFDETSFVDDEDLQASLALQRRAALKNRKKMRPEDIVRQLRQEESATPGPGTPNGDMSDQEEPGLVIDETSEFVANLHKPTIPDRARRSTSKPANIVSSVETPTTPADAEGDVDMEGSYADVKDEEITEKPLKRESSRTVTPDITSTGLGEEATLNKGLGATLAMLSDRGLIKTSASGDKNALHRERQHFLAEKQVAEAEAERRARVQRERDRASGKLDRMSAREREEYARWENNKRDQQDSRQMVDIFNKQYKPDVELRYTDEYGREMDQKEAFKHLSHQFHGKGSGKQKTEKRLKKIEDEKKRMAMSSLDSSQSTGMNSAMGATARKNRQAGVRLA